MIDKEQLRSQHKQMTTITLALLNGCVLLVGTLFWMAKTSQTAASSDVSIFLPLAIILSVAALAGSFIIKNVLLQRPAADFTARPADGVSLGKRLTMTNLVSLAMVEGAVLFGTVLAFLSRDPAYFVVPLVTGLVGFILHFPRYQEWEAWAERQ